jgi:hypothetical protein
MRQKELEKELDARLLLCSHRHIMHAGCGISICYSSIDVVVTRACVSANNA